jgi:hypothetical protein
MGDFTLGSMTSPRSGVTTELTLGCTNASFLTAVSGPFILISDHSRGDGAPDRVLLKSGVEVSSLLEKDFLPFGINSHIDLIQPQNIFGIVYILVVGSRVWPNLVLL